MASQDSSDFNELEPFEGLNLSDCTGTSRKFKFPFRLAISANNSYHSSPQSGDDSSTSFCAAATGIKKRPKRKTGFVKRLPPMGIFWDIENVRVPRLKNAAAVVQKLRERFLENYRESEFVVVCDVKKEPAQLIQELHDSQVNLIHVSSISKNAADEKLRQSLRRFADVHPAPSAIVLISSDINFASDLSHLRYREKVRVILVHNNNVADALVLCANEHHSFTSLTEDIPESMGKKDLNSHFFLTIDNLPKNMDCGKVKNRLKFLTNNCGGKCRELISTEGIASLEFTTFDLALRAQKRIQGEDVFGQKIKVSAPSVRSHTGQKIKSGLNSHTSGYGFDNKSSFSRFNNMAPPPGFESNRQINNSYLYKHSDTRKAALPTPPISADRMGPPKFRSSLNKMGNASFASCVSPMEINYECLQSGFGKENQDQLSAAAALFGHQASGNSEFSSDENGKDYPAEISTNTQPVNLNITNLDPSIEVKELRKLLANMIKEYAMIVSLNIIVQNDGSPVAKLKVNSHQEAQFIISQLHRQKLGHKRIIIAYEQNNAPDPEQLKIMVVNVLQEAPDKKMPLFKFMELLESRYLCTVSVSEVNKLKDVVRISDERGSRVISLTEEAMISSYNLSQSMLPQCIIHCPKSMQNIGWCELNSSYIPNVMISLSLFAAKLTTLLNVHLGSMPLLSFQMCFEQVFQEPLPISESGVPLEHLVSCVPNVEIKLIGPNKNIKVIQQEIKQAEESNEEQVLKSVAPSLAPNITLLCREVVDLLKNIDRCQILLTKFIPAYHHHFGRQCRVADYGFTKLFDLFEAISHVVQIMGDGYRRVITLTHSAQIRRFTSDLLRVLKVQPNKQILIHEFASAYEKTLNKQFNPVEYGLCYLNDLLCEIPENTVVVVKEEEEIYISVPKREQTVEEILKTKQFASEVIDLLRHTPYYTMLFNKFVPSYHHHFGHQCKVSDYGFTKLIELFEAIPDVVEIKEMPDGERTIGLTPLQALRILGFQVLQVIRNGGGASLKLDDLPMRYFKEFGYPLNPHVYQCESLEEVVDKLSEYVEVIHSNAGSLLRPVEMDTSPNILRVRCWALLLCPPHVKDFATFRYEYRQCYSNNFTIEALNNISNIVKLSTMNHTDFISLTPLYVLAAQLYYVICSKGGSIEFNQLEQLYEEYYSRPMKLSSFNINTVNEFYNRFNLMFYIRGSKKRSVVVLNKNLQDNIAFRYENNNTETLSNQAANVQWGQGLQIPLDANIGALKKYSPPKPDTPPTPGSSIWWSSPSKIDQPLVNFSINMPITINPQLPGSSEHLISPARHLLAIENNPWNSPMVAPEPHELPLPNKLLPKVADDSGDSGVNIQLEHSPSDNELDPLGLRSTGAIKKKPFYGTYLNFK